MKKYLVVATVLVALVALFSFSASAADVALDATATINADATTVTLDKIAINLDGDVTTTGYYTALATAGEDIVFAAQETAPITGFNIAPTALSSGALSVKFGGTDIVTASTASATFNFAFVALDANGKALGLQAYGAGNTFTATGAIDSYVVFGAEIMDATGATAAGYDVTKDVDEGETQFAVRSFRTVVEL